MVDVYNEGLQGREEYKDPVVKFAATKREEVREGRKEGGTEGGREGGREKVQARDSPHVREREYETVGG